MERWVVVDGFEQYEVSNLGRVRRSVSGKRTSIGRIVRPHFAGKGYLYVGIMKNKKQYQRAVHRLVAIAFIDNPLHLPEVNHLGRKPDNRSTKLEWRTHAGNCHYRSLHRQQNDGVYYSRHWRKWIATYSRYGKRVYLGGFKTKTAALASQNRAVRNTPHAK
jgi:hypothetical protein